MARKFHFSVISEEVLQNQKLMQDLASKIAVDIALSKSARMCISLGYIHLKNCPVNIPLNNKCATDVRETKEMEDRRSHPRNPATTN